MGYGEGTRQDGLGANWRTLPDGGRNLMKKIEARCIAANRKCKCTFKKWFELDKNYRCPMTKTRFFVEVKPKR